MKSLFILLCILFFSIPAMGENFQSIYLDGLFPINIDGDLSEWSTINPPKYAINNILVYNASSPPTSENDLSANFMCIADNNYVYVAIEVIDDKVYFGKHPFGQGWNSDAVEVCFDGDLQNISKQYFDSNDGLIRVTGDEKGNVLLEGSIPFLKVQIPYYWETRGIQSSISINNKGYNIEISIPKKVIANTESEINRTFGFNIRIFDCDCENSNGFMDHGLSWAYDPQNTSYMSTQCYNTISFKVNVDQAVTNNKELIVMKKEYYDHEIVLNLPMKSSNSENIMYEIFKIIEECQYEDAYEMINKNNIDNIWILPLEAVLADSIMHYDEAINTLNVLYDKSSDNRIKEWATIYISKIIDKIDFEKDKSINIELALKILNKTNNDIIKNSICKYILNAYYQTKQFDNAKALSKNIQSEQYYNETKNYAEMIVLSIDWESLFKW